MSREAFSGCLSVLGIVSARNQNRRDSIATERLSWSLAGSRSMTLNIFQSEETIYWAVPISLSQSARDIQGVIIPTRAALMMMMIIMKSGVVFAKLMCLVLPTNNLTGI